MCFALTPGPVNTSMGKHLDSPNRADRSLTSQLVATAALDDGDQFEMFMKKVNVSMKSVEEASVGMLKVIDSSTRDNMGGAYVRWDPEGGRFAW